MSKHIPCVFRPIPAGPKKDTGIWIVKNGSQSIVLGTVKWWAHWRRYCFFPEADMLFDANCLWDIADFCARTTTQHKEAREARNV